MRVRVFMIGRAVNITTAVALLVVISHATFTTSNEIAARYSGVGSDISLALVAAWIFNYLIVDLPRRRDRALLYPRIYWMVGLMAQSGISMMEFLANAAGQNINIDPRNGGIVIAADRATVDRICVAIGPGTPYVPIPGAVGCWELIRSQVQIARKYHRELEPWLSAFDVRVNAAMNDVILSRLSATSEKYQQIGNSTLESLSEDIYEHWKACDDLMSAHYSNVLPYMPKWRSSLPRRSRRNFTPAKHNARIIAEMRKTMVEREAMDAADRAADRR